MLLAMMLMVHWKANATLNPMSSNTACDWESMRLTRAPIVFSGLSKNRRSCLSIPRKSPTLTLWLRVCSRLEKYLLGMLRWTYLSNNVRNPAHDEKHNQAPQANDKVHQRHKIATLGQVRGREDVHDLSK